MKNIYLLFALLFSFSFFSCGSDDDNDSNEDKIAKSKSATINGEDFKFISAIVLGIDGKGDNDNQYSFTFTSGSINSSASGKVAMVTLYVEFPASESIDGTYELDKEPRSLDSWLSGYSITEFENGGVVESGTGSYNDLTEGFCTIKHNGNKNYTVYFKFKPKGQDVIEGGYSGDMQSIVQ